MPRTVTRVQGSTPNPADNSLNKMLEGFNKEKGSIDVTPGDELSPEDKAKLKKKRKKIPKKGATQEQKRKFESLFSGEMK